MFIDLGLVDSETLFGFAVLDLSRRPVLWYVSATMGAAVLGVFLFLWTIIPDRPSGAGWGGDTVGAFSVAAYRQTVLVLAWGLAGDLLSPMIILSDRSRVPPPPPVGGAAS